MLAKVSVKGDDITPLYKYLTETKGGDVKWNFTKFLIGKDGQVAERFESAVKPDDPVLTAAVESALKQ
jgi:glutathione peroxidase